MNSRLYLITPLLLFALAQCCAAGGAEIRSRRLRISMVPVNPDAVRPRPIAIANVDLRIVNRTAVVHWSTGPFTHLQYPDLTSDAFLQARVVRRLGNVSVSPRRTTDRTDLSGGDTTADVAMRIKGAGRAKVRLQIGLDNPDAAAGKHSATVVMTVTDP